MTEGNQFSSVVSPKEHSIHIFECSQFGKFESKGRFTRYDLSAGRRLGGNLACIVTADERPISESMIFFFCQRCLEGQLSVNTF